MNNVTKQVAKKAIEHLGHEQSLLADLEEFAKSLREALLREPDFKLASLDRFEDELMQRLEQVSRQRANLRAEIARVLQIQTSDATISVFTHSCSEPEAAEIRELCRGIRQQAIDLHGRAAENGSLAFRLWSLVERVTQELKGGTPEAATYDRKGLRRVA